MSQRQRAKTQGQSLMVAWQDIPWKQVHRHVCRLQKRIYRATGMRDKHQNTEERSARKRARSVLEQREAR